MKNLHNSFPLSFNELNLINFVGSEDVVRALIELGAKVDTEAEKKLTPLYWAAFWGKEITHLE